MAENVDFVSKQILILTNPYLLEDFVPKKTVGDGNCLFRAASIAAYNNENWHTDLRQRTFQEIRDNPTWYDKDDSNYCSPFANDPGIKIGKYAKYLLNTPKDGEWSDINHMLALSAVLKTPIESVFPSTQGNVCPLSRLLIGRNVLIDDDSASIIKIMWTSLTPPEKIEEFIPNHFVPLIPKEPVNISPSQDYGFPSKPKNAEHFATDLAYPNESSYADRAGNLRYFGKSSRIISCSSNYM